MTWKAFEELAAQIYKELEPNAIVTWNDHLMGKNSGQPRQIDVSIKHKIANHDLLIAIQTKDYSKPADVNVVGEFSAVLQDIRANKGILICKSGFTSSAKQLAQNLGIDLCNLHDAKTRRWELDVKIPILWVDFFPKVTLTIDIEIKGLETIEIQKDPKLWMVIIIDENKVHRGDITIQEMFAKAWSDDRVWKEPNTNYSIDYDVKDMYLMIGIPNGPLSYRKITKLKMDYVVSRKSFYGFFKAEECRGILNETNGEFVPSFLPVGQIPVKRDASWRPIDNPENSAIHFPAYFVTVENWQLELGNYSNVFTSATFTLRNKQ
jgi:hypothetical protein